MIKDIIFGISNTANMKKAINYYRPNYTILMMGEAYDMITCDYVALVNYSPLVLVGLDDIHLTIAH